MKNLETQAKVDWDIIAGKVTNLRNVSHLETTRKYLIKDVEICIQNYRKNYGRDYDPLNFLGRNSE